MSSDLIQGIRVYRGWTLKRKPAYISSDDQDISFTSIFTFSEYDFYGIRFNKNSNNSKIVLPSLQVCLVRKTYFG